MLLEDAFVLGDRDALGALFEAEAVLARSDELSLAHGRRDVVRAVSTMWERRELFLAAPDRVLQARDTALIANPCATSVARRRRDGMWRYALMRRQPKRGAR
jgi:hypothetical protein